MKRITVLPDNATHLDTVENNEDSDIFNQVQFTADKSLSVGGKIRQRSLKVFMFGDRIKAVTVTSNDGFVRAAKQQVNIKVLYIILFILFCFRTSILLCLYMNLEH